MRIVHGTLAGHGMRVENACLSGMLVADCVRSTRLTKIARERLTGSGMRVERLPVRDACVRLAHGTLVTCRGTTYGIH